MTNISDYESISLWWNKKINEILSNKKLLDKYDIISINKTCISVIMWDDITSIYKCNNIDLKKVFYTDQNIDSPYKTVINYLKNIAVKQWNKNNKIIFFGLNKNKNAFEIIKFLENNFNIEVWNILLPNINIKNLSEINNFKLAVFFSWREVKAQKIFKLYPIDNFEIKVPYSLKNSFLLYKNILYKYWKIGEIQKLENIFLSLRKKNEVLFTKAKRYWLWFIIFDYHIDKFIEDNFRWVDILQMLDDMWFKIHFFVYNLKNNLNKLKELRQKYKKIDIVSSNKILDLNNFLKNKNIKLYYSEISNDNRILSKNKEIFSIWDLEYWIEWFFRTFELLLKKCDKVGYLDYLNK